MKLISFAFPNFVKTRVFLSILQPSIVSNAAILYALFVRRVLQTIFIALFLASCSSAKKTTPAPKMIDHDLLKELCQLERNYAKKYEKKSSKELDDICKL